MLLLAIMALVWAAGVRAQDIPAQPRYGDDNIAVALYADGAPRAGETWMLALRFTPSSDEWHGYWSNPGDAGLGMDLRLALPEGWTMGAPLYPVPQRLVQELPSGPLMNHIYKGEYAVLMPIAVPDDADIAGLPRIEGFVEFLACTDTVCVPQDALLEARQGGDFARWRSEIAPKLASAASFEASGNVIRLAIPLPATVELANPHVFIANTGLVAYAEPQVFRRAGDTLVAELLLDRYQAELPAEVEGIVSFGTGAGVRFGAIAGPVPDGGEMIAGPVEYAGIPPLWTLLLGALVGGLILNIMPCVFPILSLKALSLVRAGGSEAAARAEGLAYTAGVVLACIALGGLLLALRAAGEQVGWAFQLQQPAFVIALLVLASVITANLAGVFALPGIDTGGGARRGAFATGLLAAVAATPCTGPFMAAALGAALLLPTMLALALFAALGLGLALPFLALGFVPALRRMLPRPGPWMERFRRAMAIPMGLTALALLWLAVQLGGRGFALFALVTLFGIVLALFVVGKLQQAGKMAWPAFGLVAAPFLIFGAFAMPAAYDPGEQRSAASRSLLAPQPFSAEALGEARASGNPVFVWFTADWCVTCKVNEGLAIEREATARAFADAGVIAMVGDWTDGDEAITRFLTEQGAAGVPLYLWYEPGGEAEQLPQVITADMLTERALRARRAARARGISREIRPRAVRD
ncbi:thiol:disulfide interchange protein DsbD [Qipengyuania nanhaisediminis]